MLSQYKIYFGMVALAIASATIFIAGRDYGVDKQRVVTLQVQTEFEQYKLAQVKVVNELQDKANTEAVLAQAAANDNQKVVTQVITKYRERIVEAASAPETAAGNPPCTLSKPAVEAVNSLFQK